MSVWLEVIFPDHVREEYDRELDRIIEEFGGVRRVSGSGNIQLECKSDKARRKISNAVNKRLGLANTISRGVK